MTGPGKCRRGTGQTRLRRVGCFAEGALEPPGRNPGRCRIRAGREEAMDEDRDPWTRERRLAVFDSVWRHHIPGSDASRAECPADGLPMRARIRRTAGGYSIKVYCPRCGGRNLADREDPRAAEIRPWSDAEKDAMLAHGRASHPVRCPVDGTAVGVRSHPTASCTIISIHCLRCGNRASLCR